MQFYVCCPIVATNWSSILAQFASSKKRSGQDFFIFLLLDVYHIALSTASNEANKMDQSLKKLEAETFHEFETVDAAISAGELDKSSLIIEYFDNVLKSFQKVRKKETRQTIAKRQRSIRRHLNVCNLCILR